MFVSEESFVPDQGTSTCLDAMVASLAAIYVEGVKPQPEQIERVHQGIVAAQQLLLGRSPQPLEKGAWTAVCRRPIQAGGSLSLERPASPRQQLVFSVDRQDRFFNGFAWETESAAYFFKLLPAGPGWSLRSTTIEQAPPLALRPGLPWTATPDRGHPETVSTTSELFAALGVVGKLSAASSVPPLASAIKQCSGCQRKLPENAKFCPNCGATVQNRTCPNCRKPIEPKARFCGGCGTRCST